MKTQPLPKEVTISPDVLFQELGSETVLLDLDNELYYALDEVGTRLWQPLAENGDPAAAMARLSAEYDVDEATLTHRRGNRWKPENPRLFSNDLDQASELDARANRKAPGWNNHCRPRFL